MPSLVSLAAPHEGRLCNVTSHLAGGCVSHVYRHVLAALAQRAIPQRGRSQVSCLYDCLVPFDESRYATVIIRPHHSTTYVDAAYCYDRVAWSVGFSVGSASLSVCHVVSPAKSAEAIEMSFALRTWVSLRNHLLDIAERFQPNTTI